jgi:hypothetical protein
MGNRPVLSFLLLSQFLPTRLFVWLRDLDAFECETDKAKVLQQLTPFRQRIGRLVCNWLVVCAPFISITQKWNATGLVRKQDVFYGVPLFLAAKTRFLFIAILGADDWSFTSIVKKRDEAPASLASSSAKRCLSAWRWRAGASPRSLSV